MTTRRVVPPFHDLHHASGFEEAATIDGTSRLGAPYRVIIRSAAPGVVTVSLISFVQARSAFALVLTSSRSMRAVTVGIHVFMTDHGIDWGSYVN